MVFQRSSNAPSCLSFLQHSTITLLNKALPVEGICEGVWARLPAHISAVYAYTDEALGLQPLMAASMKAMRPLDFEAVLHPIFQVRWARQ
jgi:hypothetical protein